MTFKRKSAAVMRPVFCYGQLSYQEKNAAYPRSQDISEAAHFLDYDGLIVPSARQGCLNFVVFCDRVSPAAMEITADHGPVDWKV